MNRKAIALMVELRDRYQGEICTFADTEADMAAAITMTYTDEAIGVLEPGKTSNPLVPSRT